MGAGKVLTLTEVEMYSFGLDGNGLNGCFPFFSPTDFFLRCVSVSVPPVRVCVIWSGSHMASFEVNLDSRGVLFMGREAFFFD